MPSLKLLVLSDGRPGHYHLAEGVAAAIGRRTATEVFKIDIEAHRLATPRLLKYMLATGTAGAALALRTGYGLDRNDIPAVDAVISAGGDTAVANAAVALLQGIPNIFCGTLRHLPPERFSLIVSSYERHRGRARHIVCLKPSAFDPDAGRHGPPYVFRDSAPPVLAALLIGGNSGLFTYEAAEWEKLIDFVPEVHARWGTRWLVSTSRRTGEAAADAFAALAARSDAVAELVDYRTAGPGTLPGLLARADIAVCTEDSSTMLSEAVGARLPVVGVSPRRHSFKPDEAEYRALMLARNWSRFIPLAELTLGRFASALREIVPLEQNPLDDLARQLEDRIPALFSERARR